MSTKNKPIKYNKKIKLHILFRNCSIFTSTLISHNKLKLTISFQKRKKSHLYPGAYKLHSFLKPCSRLFFFRC